MQKPRNVSIMIPHSRPTIGEEEAEAAAAVIRSGLLVDGEQTRQFERLVAEQTGAAWGVPSGRKVTRCAIRGSPRKCSRSS